MYCLSFQSGLKNSFIMFESVKDPNKNLIHAIQSKQRTTDSGSVNVNDELIKTLFFHSSWESEQKKPIDQQQENHLKQKKTMLLCLINNSLHPSTFHPTLLLQILNMWEMGH